MHILYLHQYFCPPGGGGNTRSLDFAKAWHAAGHRVTILTTAAYFPKNAIQDAPTWAFSIAPGLEVHVLNISYSHMLGFGKRVISFLKFYRIGSVYAKQSLNAPDVIYASSTPPSVGEMGRKLAKHWDIPYIFETVDVWPDVPEGMGILRNGWLKKWLHRRMKAIYDEADSIVALSEGMKAQILKAKVHPDKVHVVHNGTDTAQFGKAERLEKSVVKCIYTGTVGIANGVEAVVDAAAKIASLGRKDIQFQIVGAGNRLEAVRAYAQEKRLDNLEFCPPVPKAEVSGLLASADIGLVTFAPYKVLEANSANKWYDYLSTGLPVVTNYEGWQAEWMRVHGCGLSAAQMDPDAFVANILTLADSFALRARMGQQGRKMVLENFDRKDLSAKVLELLRAALQSKSPA